MRIEFPAGADHVNGVCSLPYKGGFWYASLSIGGGGSGSGRKDPVFSKLAQLLSSALVRNLLGLYRVIPVNNGPVKRIFCLFLCRFVDFAWADGDGAIRCRKRLVWL